MAILVGLLVGAKLAAANLQLVSPDLAGGADQTLVRDYVAVANGQLINDTITLITLKSTAFISEGSTLYWDALGAGCKLNIGDATHASALALNLDVSAAGTAALHKTFAPGQIGMPLWQKLGYGSDPGGNITLIATIVNANAGAAGNVGWRISGKNH